MSNKTVVIRAVQRMSGNATLDEIAEEIAILAAIRRGHEEADAGKVIPHEEVEKRVAAWFKNTK